MKTTDSQIKLLTELLEEDKDLQQLVQTKLAEKLAEARAKVTTLESLTQDTPRKPVREIAKKGSKNHREKILTAIKAKPGMRVSELRAFLASKGHTIDHRSLNTIIYVLKKNGDISATGDSGFSQYYLA